MSLAALGIGSNIGDGSANVVAAVEALGAVGRITAISSLYQTAAWGVTEQPDFLNAVVEIETPLEPRQLLAALQGIERALGRESTYRWGPRVIDLDILTYDDRVVHESDLIIPHERLLERAFALAPLLEIRPTFAAGRAALGTLAPAERDAVQRIGPIESRSFRAVNWDEALDRARSVAEFCARAELSTVRIDEPAFALEVRRSPAPPVELVSPAPSTDVASLANGAAGGFASNGAAHGEPPATVLRAEFVGIVRFSRPAAIVGSDVPAGREVAYVESLGIRNPIRADHAGRIAQIFVRDGDPVEYGQALFAIDAESVGV